MHVKPTQSAVFAANAGRVPQIVQALRGRADKQISLINNGDTTGNAIRELGAASRQAASASMGKAAVSPSQASAAYLAQAKG